ncbi:MAG: acetyltransferase [Bacteroidota bacterium]
MNIYGASGHSKVIIDIAKSIDISIDAIFDDNLQLTEVSGYKVVHTLSNKLLMRGTVLAIGDNKIRKIVVGKFDGKIQKGISHISSVLAPTVIIGAGTVVMANAAINAETRIGNHCIVNTGATVEHECQLGDFVHISPNAALAGNVIVGEGTHIGIGAVVIPGVKIGKWVTIGAGAVVLADVPDFAVVVGNPGKIIKYNHFEKE